METPRYDYEMFANLLKQEDLRIHSLQFSRDLSSMFIDLSNNLLFVFPTAFCKELKDVTESELYTFQIADNGTIVNWPELNASLSLQSVLQAYIHKKFPTEAEQ